MKLGFNKLWPRLARQARHARPPSHARPSQYNVSEARDHFCELVARVDLGEEIVIARAGVPVARLVATPIVTPTKPGVVRGHFVVRDLGL
jgi:prevent-host-death family protein